VRELESGIFVVGEMSYPGEAKGSDGKGDTDRLDCDRTERKAEANRHREGERTKNELDESDRLEAIPNQDVVRTDEVLRTLHSLETRNRCPTFSSQTCCLFDYDPNRSSSFY